MDILIAGGGVAGLEALLALHAVAGDRVRLTLVSPEPEFAYKPLAVAEPFALGSAQRVPLARFAETVGADLVIDAVTAVDDAAGRVELRDGSSRPFDALLVAAGARTVAGIDGIPTWWPGGDPDMLGGLLRDLEEGYAKRLAIVVPPGATWPLPAYELALMTAGEAVGMGHDDVTITVVTPEHAGLAIFGPEATAALAEELDRAGVALVTGVLASVEGDGLMLEPGGRRLDVQRMFAIPRLMGPALDGLVQDEDGFILAGGEGRVEGCERTWAAGDGVQSPVKFGGIATHQARCAAAAIARVAGVPDVPDPGEPVLHGRLLVGDHSRRLASRGDADSTPLWWPAGKIAGEHLPRWLVEHGIAPGSATSPEPGGGVTVNRTLSAMRGAEAQYLYDLGRRGRRDDPALAFKP